MTWEDEDDENEFQKITKAKTVLLIPLGSLPPIDERRFSEIYENNVLQKNQTITLSSVNFLVFIINNRNYTSGLVTDKTKFHILGNDDAQSDELVAEINVHIEYEIEKMTGSIEPQEEFQGTDNSISLKSAEAYTRDVGRGIARIDHASMNTINASDGDVIEIKGERRTVAICLPLYPKDSLFKRKQIIRMDGLIRNNAGIGLDFPITIRKMIAVVAENVVVIPLENIPPMDNEYVTIALENMPVIRGDFVMIPYFGGRLTFAVSKVIPMGYATLITKNTICQIEKKDLGQYTTLNALRGALQICNNILYYDEKNVEALIEKGQIYSTFDKNKEAMEFAEQALQIEPDNEDAKRLKKESEDKGKSNS